MKNLFIKFAILDELEKRQSDRFYNSKSRRVFFKIQKIFTANLKHTFSFEPKHYKNLKWHLYEKKPSKFYETTNETTQTKLQFVNDN